MGHPPEMIFGLTFYQWAVLALLSWILINIWKFGDSLELLDDLRGYLQQISVEAEKIRRILEEREKQ